MLTHLDLFSGIGGFSLAAEWADFKTIGFVEKDEYCQKVLKKHWPDVPIVEDIRDVEGIKQVVANAQEWGWSQFQTSDNRQEGQGQAQEQPSIGASHRVRYGDSAKGIGKLERSTPEIPTDRQAPVEPVTLITGGFPCQSFSVAGKRKGKEDDRYLWPEMLAVIKAIRPTWVLAENVAGIIPMALDTVLSDLVGSGYSAEVVVIPACAINAPHRRDRVWIVAYADRGWQLQSQGSIRNIRRWVSNSSQDVADTTDRGNQRSSAQCDVGGFQDQVLREGWNPDHWAAEPELGRVAHGIPHRVDRLRCLGNAIVPQVAYEILRGIAEIEAL